MHIKACKTVLLGQCWHVIKVFSSDTAEQDLGSQLFSSKDFFYRADVCDAADAESEKIPAANLLLPS